MRADRPRDVIIFALVIGIISYFLSALWFALVLTPVEQADDWCTEAVEVQTGPVEVEWRCLKFLNTLEELKYIHNSRQLDLNKYWLILLSGLGGGAGVLCFSVFPRRRLGRESSSDAWLAGLVIGVAAALLMPQLISAVLPPPIEWFPSAIVQAAEDRQAEVLETLMKTAGYGVE